MPILGILNLTPSDEKQAGELVGLDELRGRVDESAKLGEQLLAMQVDFGRTRATPYLDFPAKSGD